MIIYYNRQIFSLQKYGGISRYFFELAKAINGIGKHKPYIIGGIYDNEYLVGQKLPFIKGIQRSVLIENVVRNRYYDLSEEAQKMAENLSTLFLGKPDIIHETYYNLKPVFKRKTPIVTTIHDMIYEKYPVQFSDAKQVIDAKRNSIERAGHIIAVSNNTKKDLMDCYNINSDKISVVYHGVSEILFPAGEAPFNSSYILYVGRRGGYKNFRLLLNAFAGNKEILVNYNLVAFGGGGETSEESNFIKKNGLTGKVIFCEGNDELLGALYANAVVFVYPSLYEGWGMPPLEAMQAGCAVISSNAGPIPEAVGDAALLFNPSSEDDLSDALSELLGNEELRKSYIAKGKEHVKKFTWLKTAENTIEVYQKCLTEIHG